MWLLLSLALLLPQPQPYSVTKYAGTIPQETQWDCGPACAQTVLILAGLDAHPFQRPDQSKGTVIISFADLVQYFAAHNVTAEGYKLTWDHLETFFTASPYSPLIAHRDLEDGHFVVLLGKADTRILIADPSRGVLLVPISDFLADWSGYILHFPELSQDPAVINSVRQLHKQTKTRIGLLQNSR